MMRFIVAALLISCAVSEDQQCVGSECDDSIAMLRVDQKEKATPEKLHSVAKKSGTADQAKLEAQAKAANFAQKSDPQQPAMLAPPARPLRKRDFHTSTTRVAPNGAVQRLPKYGKYDKFR
eukprot:gnl/TRDRNA2_/TRDRNA2_190768_c0_seq1.p1 gnl/TRDRNA2_/TRDRNA2_190768_c0~~gnl/TRDRNA2_/TRDRNA2_190768_c0_seq1.p1  ORF type:complete len:121 (-),score=26.29 gnl/TRDRNA2_/TRDRNA2_190768_c0_seq1:70-432(-)